MRRGPKCQEKKKELGSYRKEKEKATVRSAPDGSDNKSQMSVSFVGKMLSKSKYDIFTRCLTNNGKSLSICKALQSGRALTILGFCAHQRHWRNLTRTRTHVRHIDKISDPTSSFFRFKFTPPICFGWWCSGKMLMTPLDIKLFGDSTRIPTTARYRRLVSAHLALYVEEHNYTWIHINLPAESFMSFMCILARQTKTWFTGGN